MMNEINEALTKSLLKKRDENEQEIQALKERNQELTKRMWAINGSCPYCRNPHYPHCKPT